MKLSIKNLFGDKFILDVPATYTIRQVIAELYSKNINLHNQISSKIYENAVQLSLNGTKLGLEQALSDCRMDILGTGEVSDIELTAIQEIPGLDNLYLLDLQLEAPEIPNELCCPLSTLIFRNPIVLPCGTVAEKGFVLQWVMEKNTCPFTRQALLPETVLQFEPDIELQKRVAVFLQQHQGKAYFNELEKLQYPEEMPEISAPSAAGLPIPRLRDRAIGGHPVEAEAQAHFQIALDFDENWMRIVTPRRFFRSRARISPINHSGNEYIARHIEETVIELRDHGVTEDLIIQHWQPNHITDGWVGKETLIFLIKGTPPRAIVLDRPVNPLPENLRLQPIAALQEMSCLNSHGMTALYKLYERGLRGNHLRALHGHFKHGHEAALIHLVQEHNFSVNQALEQITGITEDAAWDILRSYHRASLAMHS